VQDELYGSNASDNKVVTEVFLLCNEWTPRTLDLDCCPRCALPARLPLELFLRIYLLDVCRAAIASYSYNYSSRNLPKMLESQQICSHKLECNDQK